MRSLRVALDQRISSDDHHQVCGGRILELNQGEFRTGPRIIYILKSETRLDYLKVLL